MRNLEQWLAEYSVSHKNPTNKKIHNICVPAIMFSLLGLLWSIPVPDIFLNVPFLNWSTIFFLLAILFYLSLNVGLTFVSLLFVIPMYVGIYYIDKLSSFPLVHISWIIFVVAWIGQFIGHKIEGKKPSFFQDLAFLLIGPLWVFHPVYALLFKKG